MHTSTLFGTVGFKHIVKRILPFALLTSGLNAEILHLSFSDFGDGVAEINDLQLTTTASTADEYVFSRTASASGLGSGNGTLFHSAAGRARVGDLGVQIGLSGVDYDFSRLTGRGIYTDTVTYQTAGTPEYLQVDMDISGTGSSSDDVYWYVFGQNMLGSADFRLAAGCFTGHAAKDCRGNSYLGPQSGPAVQYSSSTPPDYGFRQTVRIPLSMVMPDNNTILVYSELRVEFVGQPTNGSGFASVDYLNTSRLGGFRLLDIDGNVLPTTFTSATGFDYTRPLSDPEAIPEPASFLLTITALGALAYHRKSTKRQAD